MCLSGKERAKEEGYIPHNDACFTCAKCGWDTFKCYPQGVSMDAEVWGLEYVCARCGAMTTLYNERN